MRERSIVSDISTLLPLFISGLLCIGLSFLLWQKTTTDPTFVTTLNEVSIVFISISGFLSAIIMVYLVAAAMSMKRNRTTAIDSLSKVTQKMHHFRNIVELLLRSKMWLSGLKEYIDEEFSGLTFFDVKEFYKGKSKLAIEFLQENHHYADTENLYLELKSLLMTHPREKSLPEAIKYPRAYANEIVQKWLEHKCGSGLWYYFGYKYGIYKESLDYNAVFERHQEKIMTLAHSIDAEAFEDSSFNEVFLSKLGEYMSQEVIPKLLQFQEKTGRRVPGMLRYLYIIFLVLIIAGVLLPLLHLLFSFTIIALVISYALVISTLFFISISLLPFLSREINR
ncbi:hypothetical protein [Altibacter sp. HG106]|uniref:hypothetical protein n=1 Tax=Altibacter sp. HG106 TaxID=3023937 RepID=UPI00235031DF|nr:hypothetical protein [Altibacter sp. HG106]MDC7995385.1 hypothetical protein [Altibacter sp. HG106]